MDAIRLMRFNLDNWRNLEQIETDWNSWYRIGNTYEKLIANCIHSLVRLSLFGLINWRNLEQDEMTDKKSIVFMKNYAQIAYNHVLI